MPKAGEIGGKRQRRKKQPPLENVRVTISGEGDRVVEPTDKTAEEWEEVEGNDNDWEEDHAMYGASVIGNDLEDTNFLDETLSSPAAILLMEPSPTDKTNLNQLDLLGMTESFERLPVEQRYTLVVPESIDIGSNRDSLDEIEKEMIAKMNENIEATDAFFGIDIQISFIAITILITPSNLIFQFYC